MNQKRHMITKWFRGIAFCLAFLLALPSALANLGTLSAAAADAAEPSKYGDINGDGEVDAQDALQALQGAAKLITLSETQKKFGNVDGKDEVTASDALLILQLAAHIIPKFPVEDQQQMYTPRPMPTATPEGTPRPTAPVQTYAPENVRKGTAVKVVEDKTNNAVYDAANDIWVMAENMDEGIQIENPIGGKEEFAEDYSYLRKATPAAHKLNPWDLNGSELGWNADDGKDVGLDHSDPKVDHRIYNAPVMEADDELPYDEDNPQAVDYDIIPQKTAPEGGHKGLSISFWLQTPNDKDGAPLLTFFDRNYSVIVSVNGSVRFGTSTLEHNKLVNSRYEYFTNNEWHYYTVTFANDWITIYVDGYEVPFDNVDIKRSSIDFFNDGFMTRYNAAVTWTEEDYKTDWRGYLQEQYRENAHQDYESITIDDYTVFGNTRYRGTHSSKSTGAKLLLTHMMSNNTKVYIGGANTNVLGKQAEHSMTKGTLVSGITYNLEELNAAQVFANYTEAEKDKPGTTSVTPVPDQEGTEATPLPSVDRLEGRAFPVVEDSIDAIATVAKDDKDLDHYTFKAASNPNEDAGVEFENLFENEEEKALISETLDSALDTWKSKNNQTELFPQGTFGGAAANLISYYENYGDIYYGDPALNPVNEETGEFTRPDKSDPHPFHRPVWSKGASIGFWLKPTAELLDSNSPVMTIYGDKAVMFTLEADGSLCYLDMHDSSWSSGEAGKLNKWCQNAFMTKGDKKFVNADEWNYYVVTFANDWIQVYVNGVEVVYQDAGIRRQSMKDFNGGFLSRYNQVGLQGPEDKDYNDYIKKSGGITEKLATWDGGETPADNDTTSIRANNVYFEGPHYEKEVADGDYQNMLLIDNLTSANASVYMGGCPSMLSKTYGWGVEGSPTKRIRYTDHELAAGIEFADLRFFEDELDKEDMATVYQKAKDRLGTVSGGQTPSQPTVEETAPPTEPEGLVSPVRMHASASWESKNNVNVYTFSKPVAESIETYKFKKTEGRVTKVEDHPEPLYYGVEMNNPMAGNTALQETIIDALAGQTVVKSSSTDPDILAASAAGAYNEATFDGKDFGDSYNGVKYQKPKWNKGASFSFWYKPADLEDTSPILYMCGDLNKGGAFALMADGSVLFASLMARDWTAGKIGSNACFNCFDAIGDKSMVTEGAWNYYTVTLANDWIQVYINGKEMKYTWANLAGKKLSSSKFNLQFFNAGFLTRYNPIGQIPFNETSRYYVEKAGGLADPANNDFNLLCSIRSSGVYATADGYFPVEEKGSQYCIGLNEKGEDDNKAAEDSKMRMLMMDLLTDPAMKLYMGGADSLLSTKNGAVLVVRDDPEKGVYSGGEKGWNANTYGDDKEDFADKSDEANKINPYIPSGVKAKEFYFNSKHNQEGSSFAMLHFDAKELTPEEVQAAYAALTADPDGNPIAK